MSTHDAVDVEPEDVDDPDEDEDDLDLDDWLVSDDPPPHAAATAAIAAAPSSPRASRRETGVSMGAMIPFAPVSALYGTGSVCTR